MPFPDDPDPPHARFLRLGRWSEHYACYAVTKNVENRSPVLAAPQRADIIVESLQYLRSTDRIRLMAFCIMPDHYHALFFLLPQADTLSALMRQVGRHTARHINAALGRSGQFWQEGFYDHRCRSEDDMIDRASYIEHNPVRKDLVQRAEQWVYSSAHPSRAEMLDRQWYSESG